MIRKRAEAVLSHQPGHDVARLAQVPLGVLNGPACDERLLHAGSRSTFD